MVIYGRANVFVKVQNREEQPKNIHVQAVKMYKESHGRC